jgi:hypothetical protein
LSALFRPRKLAPSSLSIHYLSRGSNGQALTGGFRAAAKANAYRYADITAARKQAKFHASIGVMLSISAFR